MEETSWYMNILSNPFFRGLAVGVAIWLFFWVRSRIRIRELSNNVRKLREHLHTKLEIDSAENERRKKEIEKLKEERDNLRNMVQVLNQKPERREIRQSQVYQRALDIMFEKAPGFAPAWQVTLKEAEEEMQSAEKGIIPFFKRLTGTTVKSHEDFEGERKKALDFKESSHSS
jgi:predicted RNase H-like nuclease (RuvC/YqgF family)